MVNPAVVAALASMFKIESNPEMVANAVLNYWNTQSTFSIIVNTSGWS